MPSEPELREPSLRELLADAPWAAPLVYFEPYERVHRRNVEAVLSAGGA